MTKTILASATKELVIGFEQPFCVIGERINPTGRKKLATEMKPTTQVYQMNISNIDKSKKVIQNIIRLLSNEHSLNIKSFSDNINFDFNNTSDEIGVVVRNDRLIDW